MVIAASQKYSPKDVEHRILQFWKEHDTFQQSIIQRKGYPRYVFLEGPPTANGLPHPGHILTRVMKDLVLRYQTMTGHYILRKAGWDTHGLPVEIEVEKKLGLTNKQDIERYGIEKFNEECRKSVFKYEHAWVEMSERIGFWLDMDHPYITLKNEYIESVWWSLKQAFDKGLLYKGHKVVPYCPRCGTALSAHEISQGYKTIEEPSIFVKFKIKDEDAYFLAWTTTPWTLISNVALAVNPTAIYLKIRYHDQTLIFAEERVTILLKGQEYEVLDSFPGKDLEYKEYEPLFCFAKPDRKAWYVVLADFVTMEDGTGIVHIAPAFGEDDYAVGRKYNLPVVQLVNLDGTFPQEVTPWCGQFVKTADPLIITELEKSGVLEGTKLYSHEYPFCWRCDSPLLYYAMESWFIAMPKVQDSLTRNNDKIAWYPTHLQYGRFGDFIKDVKDWALSRDRYWGTPLPIWICENKSCRHAICVGSVNELKTLTDNFPKTYDLHKPFVDDLHVTCPRCHGRLIREPDVIDCWYDSGSAFFAQWHYPFENKPEFTTNYPVDFICEALDQTRGWFYSLLAISTFLFDNTPYKSCLTLGLVLDKDNQKMSKSKKNYVDPTIILDHEGADALRWYLISANAPWMSTRFYEDAIKETLGKFILTLWNSYSFFTTYAALDHYDPTTTPPPIDTRPLLDRWILSRYHHLIADIHDNMSHFDTHKAARAIESFLIDDYSNWYLRRSRKRLWTETDTPDKHAAYATLYDITLGLTQLLAPFTPFITEDIYQNLKTPTMPHSIHLNDYPTSDPHYINPTLDDGMTKIRSLVEAGRALRSKIQIKGRQPLPEAVIITPTTTQDTIRPLISLLQDELNVKKITFNTDTTGLTIKTAKPKQATLGRRFKAKAKDIVHALDLMPNHDLTTQLLTHHHVTITVGAEAITLPDTDFDITEHEKPHYAKTQTADATLFLNTSVTPQLEAEGLARELIRRIQSMRKDLNLSVDDHITVTLTLPPTTPELTYWHDHIKTETRATTLTLTPTPTGTLVKTWDIDDLTTTIGINPDHQKHRTK